MHTLVGHSRCVRSVAFSRDGTRVVSGSSDKLVKIWNVETGVEVSSLKRALGGAWNYVGFPRGGKPRCLS